jgi:hypothetical protein
MPAFKPPSSASLTGLYLAHSSSLKREAVDSSQISVDFYQTTWRGTCQKIVLYYLEGYEMNIH